MKEKKTSEVKSNVISSMSSTVGAAAGVVAGSVISSEVNAAEVPAAPEEAQEVEVVSSQPSNTTHHNPTPAPEPEPTPEPEPDPEPEPRPEPTPQPEPEPNPGPTPEEPEIEVVSYETVTNEDGSQMDVAVVNAQGQTVMIADVDQNGVADVMASDLNNNGQLDNGEIVDISEQNIAMQPLQEAANMGGNEMIAQTNDVDYINDANVDDYIA
jgi:outer membrane biosynthesis protein TonB